MPRSSSRSSRGRRTLGHGDGVIRSGSRGRRKGRRSTTNLSRGAHTANADYYEAAAGISLSKGTGLNGPKLRRVLILAVLCAVVLGLIVHHAKNSDGSSSSRHRHSGDPFRAFERVKQASLDHFHAEAKVYKHKNTGLQLVTLEQPKDGASQDGVFGMSFRTLPTNSHGTAHVVSEAIQLGSTKFPVKDAWNQIRQGSLQTHLEANTMRDRTEYLLATPSAKDLTNSMQVMLDSFFQPNMILPSHTWAFRQEAWRLEQSDDAKTIFLHGNAYDHAKIDQMHPNKYMNNFLFKKLFPESPTHYNERGEQSEILKMTHDEVIDFWRKYYHPNNAQAMCYGSAAMVHACVSEIHLVLDELFPEPENSVIRDNTVPPFQTLDTNFASRDRMPYASYRDDVDFRVVLAWAINGRELDHVTQIAWMVIEDMLMGNTAAALGPVVSEQEWGDDVIGKLERDYQQWILAIGASGIQSEDDVDRVVDEMNQLLLNVVTNGFDDTAMVASMNKIEYQLLHKHAPGLPRGVDIFKRLMTDWNYDREPIAALDVTNHMKLLRDEVHRNGQQYFLDLMTLHMMDNGHKLTLELYPSLKVASIHREQEAKFLADLTKNLKKSEGAALLAESAAMKAVHGTDDDPEDLAKIPRLTPKDIPLDGNVIPLKVDKDVVESGVDVLEHRLDHTNGIAHINFAIDTSGLDFDDVILLPFYCYMSTRTGNNDRSAAEFIRHIEANTGGLEIEPLIEDILPLSSDNGYYIPSGKHLITKIVARGNAAVSNSHSAFLMITDSINFADFSDAKVAKQLLRKLIDDMEDDIQVNGHKYTTLRLESLNSLPGFVREKWYGINQLYQLRQMLQDLEDGNWSTYTARFNTMRKIILGGSRNGQTLSIAADYDTIVKFSPSIRKFLTEGLPAITTGTPRFPDFSQFDHPWYTKGYKSLENARTASHTNEAFVVPTRLSHVGEGGRVFEEGAKITGSDLTVAQYIEGFYLWNKLAVLGAHDATAIIDMDSGWFVYQSDEDPSPGATIKIYDAGAAFVYNNMGTSGDFPIELQAAMIGAVAKLDGPTPQADRAGHISMRRYFRKETDEQRRKIREDIMATTRAEMSDMLSRLSAWTSSRRIVITNSYFYSQQGTALELQKCSLKEFSC